MQSTARRLTGLTGGNGSLMRTAAVGLAYLGDDKACTEAALAVSELTHHDERAGQACQLWSYAIRHAVLHGTFDGVHGYLDTAGADADFWRPLLEQAERRHTEGLSQERLGSARITDGLVGDHPRQPEERDASSGRA